MTTDTLNLKQTALHDFHVALGGKMVDFAGWHLPIQYTSIMEEHLHVRSQAGIFDVSHLGEIVVKGKGALAFLQKRVPNDLSKQADSQIYYSMVLNEQGGIQDDILIYRENSESFYLVVNASNISKIEKALRDYAPKDVEIKNDSDRCSCIAIQGPKALQICEALTGKGLADMKYYHYKPVSGDYGQAWVSRSGYTGEDGFEYFADADAIRKLWKLFIEKGRSMDLLPAGLGCRNTLRLEVGNGLYGNDFDETTTPMESRLGFLVDWNKDFVGKAALLKKKEDKNQRRICGFKMKDRAVPREHYAIFKDGAKIGEVTSGTYSPSLKESIGLARVTADAAKIGTTFEVEIHGRKIAAEVVKLPFVPIRHL